MYDFYLTKEDENDMIFYQNRQIERMEEECLRVFELMPIDGRKSFNNRAKVLETENGYYLLSYNTIVCYLDKPGNINTQFCKCWGGYSVTTMRHINAFMRFNGLSLGGKKWWTSLEYNKLYSVSELLNIV